MTDTDLTSAVQDLTTPDTLTRYVGTDHDHSWMELVRPITAAEKAAAKATKVKPPKVVKTGEWWCPFCELTTAVRPQEDEIKHIDRRDDPSLLDQLEARVRSTLSDGGASGRGGASVLVDVAAYDLSRRIEARMREWLGEVRATPGNGLSLRQLVTSWHQLYIGGVHPVGDDDRRSKNLEEWATEIRDILDPPDQIPYRGQPCPLCGETRALRDIAGEVDNTVALWAVLRPAYRNEGSYGICRACDKILAHDPDPITLRQRMNGTITAATRLTQTVGDAADIR